MTASDFTGRSRYYAKTIHKCKIVMCCEVGDVILCVSGDDVRVE